MSTLSPEHRCCAPLSRRNVLLGLAASALPAPAIVRVSSLMPIRCVVLIETNRPSAGYIERLFYNALIADLRRGHIRVRINNIVPTLSEAERLVSRARRSGWIVEQPRALGDVRIREGFS